VQTNYHCAVTGFPAMFKFLGQRFLLELLKKWQKIYGNGTVYFANYTVNVDNVIRRLSLAPIISGMR
jgi:hypothetical protein